MTGALKTFRYEVAGKARGTVVLSHGLLATSRFFDVPGQEECSLPRWLASQGFRAVSFDHRGMGASQDAAPSADFGYAELVEDLCGVTGEVAREDERIVLLGHSLGGATAYGALALAEAERLPWFSGVRGVITIASPAILRPRGGLWRDLFSERALALLNKLRTPGGWIDLVEFTLAQGMIADPKLCAGPLLRHGIAAGLWLGSHSARVAGLLMKKRSLPTFLYNAGDYTPEQFRDVLAGGVLNRAPVRLVREVIAMGMSEGPAGGHLRLPRDGGVLDVTAAVGSMDVPVLAFASEEDQLVTVREAHAFADRPGLVKVLLPPCGHGGYFFKRPTRAALRERAASFLDAILPRA